MRNYIKLLLLCFVNFIGAQDLNELYKSTNGMEYFYTNPLKYQKELPKALILADSLLQNYPNNNELLRIKAEVMRYNFYFVRSTQTADSVFNYINQHKKIREIIGDSCNLSVIYRNLSAFWKQKSNYDKGLENIDAAYSIAKQCNDIESKYIISISKLKAIYRSNRSNDTLRTRIAKEFKTILSEVDSLKISRCQGSLTNALATLYIYEKKYDSVGKYLKLAEKIYLERKDVIGLKSVNRRLASYYKRGEGNIPKAITYYKKSLEINEALNDQVALIKNYLGLSNTYNQIGDYKTAIEYYKKYSETRDRVKEIENYRKIVDLELSYKYNQQKKIDSIAFVKERKILSIEGEKNTYKKQLYFSLLILTILLGALISFVFRKRWLQIKEQKEELAQRLYYTKMQKDQRIKLLNSDIDNLNTQISSKRSEITQLMTESLQHIKTKEKIVDDLKKIASNSNTIEIKSIIADLKSDTIEDNRLVLIKNHLEELNFDFFKNLKSKHPELTKTDLEICSYIKLGLERKEIAKLRFTTTNAVKKSRNRLRKRLNLNIEDDLDHYVKSF